MTLYGWRLAVVAFGVLFAIWLGWNPDARFESSDGAWWDNTVHLKGRDFDTIKSDFQEYRAKCNKPTVSLARTTAIEPWVVTSWPWYIFKREWRVPYMPAQKSKNLAPRGRRVVRSSARQTSNNRLERSRSRLRCVKERVDDWDKVPWFDAGEAARRST